MAPDHVVSGNYERNGDWVWSRRIQVRPFAGLNNRSVRYVTVRIFKRDRDGNEPDGGSVCGDQLIGGAFPTQVYDVTSWRSRAA